MISDKMMEMAKQNVDAYIEVVVKFFSDDRLPKAQAKYFATLFKELVNNGFKPEQAIEVLTSLPTIT